MEPVTHFLTGACMARAGFTRKTALATATMVLAAEAPDIDMLWYLGGSSVGFVHHRGFTHTLIGIPVLSALVVVLMYAWHRWRSRGEGPFPRPAGEAGPLAPRWGVLFALACLAGYAHLLLDFTNNYGVRPFFPFNAKWYSWDIVYIIEPVILVVLLVGLVLPMLFSLVNEEIGAQRTTSRGRGGAIFALVALLMIWGFRDFQHRRAVEALRSMVYQNEPPLRVSAYPYHTNPFAWHGVVETDTFYETVHVDSSRPEVDPNGRALVYYKPEETAAIRAAKDSYLGRGYFDWSVYPVIEQEKRNPEGGYVVRFRDLRFATPERRFTPLSAYVLLDENLKVMDAGFRSRNPVRDRLESDAPPENGGTR
ncbi:MAG TPA: metal-dependent hydrolase [Clostridia bacterium]|nr:metal-dependent hydrolase [Clostridia bacterium]